MSTTAKTGIALVLILVLLVVSWILVSDKNIETPIDTTAMATIAPTPTPKLPNTAGMGLSDMTDNSNEGIDNDIKAVGTQMDQLNSDNTVVDQGLKEAI